MMLNLDLTINSCQINLGKNIDSDVIQKASLNKLGFIIKLFLIKPKDTIIYWAKNCEITCFGLKTWIMPSLGSNDTFMFGTAAYLYTANDIIYKIVYQLLGNKYYAFSEFEIFSKTCSAIHGEPIKQHEKLRIWEDERSGIICEIGNNEENHFVYWLLKDPCAQAKT